eukprot:m.37336 g.37336  ORF g.37336 m.37336 type:complete len:486 (+) comp17637_c0_seq1:269-1726(+)
METAAHDLDAGSSPDVIHLGSGSDSDSWFELDESAPRLNQENAPATLDTYSSANPSNNNAVQVSRTPASLNGNLPQTPISTPGRTTASPNLNSTKFQQQQQRHQQHQVLKQQKQQHLARDPRTPLHVSSKRSRGNSAINTGIGTTRDNVDNTSHRPLQRARIITSVNHNHTTVVAAPAPKKLLIITLYPASIGWKSGTSHKYLVQKHGGRWDRIKAETSISTLLRDKNPATVCVEGDLSQEEIHSLFVKAISEGVPVRLCRLFERSTFTTPDGNVGGKEKRSGDHGELTLLHVQQPSYHVDDQIYTVREENCAVCLKTQKELSDSATNSLRQCSKCKVRKYCSRGCQVKDWVNHKIPCERSARALETSREYSISKCGFNHRSSPVHKLFMSRHTTQRIADFEEEVCRMNSNIRKMARRLAASREPVGGDSLVGLDFVPFSKEEDDDSDAEVISNTTTAPHEPSTHASVCCRTESHNWSRIYPCFQ